jgi:prepilin-type N-terminal cleavage/methylation domain-containing protein
MNELHKGRTMRNTWTGYRPRTYAFTLIEMLIVVLLMAITSTIAMDVIAETEAGLRPDRAAREAVCAILYARAMAISYGGNFGVEFDTANNRFQVFQTTGGNVVAQSMYGGGTYVINLSRPELKGTTMTVAIAGDATNPYDLIYAPLGNTSNNGTVVFSYGGKQKTVTIPKVGDPTIN